jgi:hypothetical protein
MQPERAPQPEPPEDTPLDAIVFDTHPALLARNDAVRHAAGSDPRGESPFATRAVDAYYADYPYADQSLSRSGDQASGELAGRGFPLRPEDVYTPPPTFELPTFLNKADYVVPQRFGLSAIFGITTALAFLFGCMHWLESPPGVYLFLGLQSVVICLVQMFHGKTPRIASAAAGAVIAMVFVVGSMWLFSRRSPHPLEMFALIVLSIPIGGFLGYLTGTCAAGVFLIMAKLEPYLQGERAGTAITPPHGTSAA